MREEKEKTIYKMNHKWNYQPPSQEQTEAAKALAKETGINPVLCKLLLERLYTGMDMPVEEVKEKFFHE